MGARRKGRELAVQMLYQWDVSKQSVGEILLTSEGLSPAGDEARRFASLLFVGTARKVEVIDRVIAQHSERWRLSRMPTVDRNILRVAVWEFMELDTPKNVVIDEAVELAKRFAAPESAGFVNGVLDALLSGLATPRTAAAEPE